MRIRKRRQKSYTPEYRINKLFAEKAVSLRKKGLNLYEIASALNMRVKDVYKALRQRIPEIESAGSKLCAHCGGRFLKPTSYYRLYNWENRRFCSSYCKGRASYLKTKKTLRKEI